MRGRERIRRCTQQRETTLIAKTEFKILSHHSAMATTQLRLKLLIDNKAQKVLFAEVGKDFVDFLFNLLSLPVGTVVRLHKSHSMGGCLVNLYESVEKLSNTYMQPNQTKDCLLNPIAATSVSHVPLLLPTDVSTPRKYYQCGNCSYNRVTDNPSTNCPNCNRKMSSELTYVDPNSTTANASSSTGEGGYVKGVVTYMVMDDLVVTPMSTISSVTLLNKFNVKDLSSLEEMDVDFGMEEGLELLRASFQSTTVLTHIFLGKKGN
ncbi:hypothetical protein HHK36_032786 [Tetracentron sinense]|uniref:Uncharacterized protein n=1 Tax=Tetracentron sinense TaxID=13715 RepID=A0A834Y4Y8_TETSI|nr:hypothetical protein HHK36_032786 [Tetracentron sinense]